MRRASLPSPGSPGRRLASFRRVASVRAGVSPPPPPDLQTPLDRMLLALREERSASKPSWRKRWAPKKRTSSSAPTRMFALPVQARTLSTTTRYGVIGVMASI